MHKSKNTKRIKVILSFIDKSLNKKVYIKRWIYIYMYCKRLSLMGDTFYYYYYYYLHYYHLVDDDDGNDDDGIYFCSFCGTSIQFNMEKY